MDPNASINGGRVPFRDLTNVSSDTPTQNTPSIYAQHKKEVTSARQREYRVKKKLESNTVITPFIFTTPKPLSENELLDKQKKEEKNKKQREWRARTALSKDESSSIGHIASSVNVIHNLTPTELLASGQKDLETEKKSEKNRKQREWRVKKESSTSIADSVTSDIVMHSLTPAELLAKENRELFTRQQCERRAKRKAESNLVEDSVPTDNVILEPTSCHSQLSESQEGQQSGLSATEKKREQRNKYMCEYRARKKAKLSNINGENTTPSTSTVGASSVNTEGSMYGTTCSAILEDPNGANKENLHLDNSDDWLHRNDSYIPRFNARKTSSLQQEGESLVLSETILVIQCIALCLKCAPMLMSIINT